MLRDEAQHKDFSLALELNNPNEGATRVMQSHYKQTFFLCPLPATVDKRCGSYDEYEKGKCGEGAHKAWSGWTEGKKPGQSCYF